MCCCIAPRCSIIFAGIWCLIQSIAWAIAAIVGISVYKCDIPVANDLTDSSFYLYFVYFFNKECADIPDQLDLGNIFDGFVTTPISITPPDPFTTPFPIPRWPSSFSSAEYTYTLLSLYVGFNVAWAVSCVIVIVAAARNVRSWFAYAPWILLAAANIILDIVATVHYVNDALAAETAQGLLEEVIGLDLSGIDQSYKDQFFNNPIFDSVQGVTMIPSAVMAILTSRLGILWLLNVLYFICVFASVFQLSKKREKTEHQTTYPHPEPRNQGFHNQAYIEETHTNETGPEYGQFNEQGYSRPYDNTGNDLKSSFMTPQTHTNGAPASSIPVPATKLRSSATPPYYMELRHVQHYHHQPSAPGDEYQRQALKRMPVPSDHKGINGAVEQIRAPHIHRTDSERYSQPSIQNRPPATIPFPRPDLHSPAARTDEEYLEPRQGFQNSFSSADNYMPTPLNRPSATHDVRGNSEPDGQRKAPHLHRTESDRPPYRPPVPMKNLRRRTSHRDEVDRPQDHNRRTTHRDEVDRPQDHNSNADRRLSESLANPIASLPPDELRNQLPWSYFGPRNAAKKPKTIQESVQEEELEKPPVPVPDYTLHFGKTTRPVASNWTDDVTSDSVPSHRGTTAIGLDDNRY